MDIKKLLKSIFSRNKNSTRKTIKKINDTNDQLNEDNTPSSQMAAQANDNVRNSSRHVDSPQPARLFPSPAHVDIPSAEYFARMTETPTVDTADATNLPAPDGLKVALDLSGPPRQFHPVLRWGEYTYWPLSYIDNRVSMAIVVIDSAGHIVKTLEAEGARYLKQIQVYNLEVRFIGQENQVATLQWRHLFVPSAVNPRSPTNPHSDEPRPTGISLITNEETLERYFLPSKKTYTDADFDSIAILLDKTGLRGYIKSPRLYTLLRRLECLKDLDRVLEKGLSDNSLPLSQSKLPSDFTEGWKLRFLNAQRLVCDNSEVVQLINIKKHMPLSKAPDFFKSERFFGRGGRGEVDKVCCTLGQFKYYARKRMPRPNMANHDTAVMTAFRNEVNCLKRIKHRHCVELVASYTDPSSFAILMLPVADCNLADYLQNAVSSDNDRSFLPDFFGCLSRGLWHIHSQQFRHRDIKPENILIHDHKVLFTDFDCSLDWSHTVHSTTDQVPPRTKEYASPEVARSGFVQNTKINSSSDIWSLGCVFLEIITVWKRRSIKDLHDLRNTCYCNNSDEISEWIRELQSISTHPPSMNQSLEWIRKMLQDGPGDRPTAHELVEKTSDFCCFECKEEDSGSRYT
ncbi:kinase-like domain-containing protein [Annulohypoxylon bovei var. microspora]|nr:kinase-like domain-containing protein [Annulohypoxylon bovei var. microspora]